MKRKIYYYKLDMDETRVSRYQEYRQSFIKEGSIVSEEPVEETSFDLGATTSTLPMDEVINAVQEENKKEQIVKKEKRHANVKLIVEIVVATIIVAALVVLGIYAWGN